MAKMKISKETRGAAPKLIIPDPAVNKGLVVTFIKSVEVVDVEVSNADGAWKDFDGHKVPKLVINFIEIPSIKGKVAGSYPWTMSPIPHIPNSTTYDWWFDSNQQMIKHFIDAFIGADNFKDEYEKLLSIDLDDTKELPVETVLDAHRKFYEGVATVFNGDGKKLESIFKDKDGNSYPVWTKLLLYVKNNKVNGGNFGFPSYPGDGVIELVRKGYEPSISIKIAKGESIIPRDTNDMIPTKGKTADNQDETSAGGQAMPDWVNKAAAANNAAGK
jgi:hypothetical protein